MEIEDEGLLEALRNEGLFIDDDLEPDAAEKPRVAASLMRELGVDPAGVDVALHLRRRLACLEGRMRELLQRLADEAGPPIRAVGKDFSRQRKRYSSRSASAHRNVLETQRFTPVLKVARGLL